MISVITRTKDRAIFLSRVFNSLKSQTYRPIEWILVNDAGINIDTYVEEFMKYSTDDFRIKYLYKDISTTMEAATNYGLQNATGKYINILDDDDTLEQTFYEDAITYLENESIDSIKGVIGYSQYIYEKITNDKDIEFIKQEAFPNKPQHITISAMLVSNQFPIHSFVYNSDVLDEIGFYDEELPVLGDWEFNIRFVQKFDIGVIPKVYANYHRRIDESYGNTITTQVDQHVKYEAYLRNKILRNYKNNPQIAIDMGQSSNSKVLMNEILSIEQTLSMINSEKNEQIVQRDRVIAEKNEQIAQRDSVIAEKNEQIAQRDSVIAEKNEQIVQKNLLLQNSQQETLEKQVKINELTHKQKELQQLLKQKEIESTHFRHLAESLRLKSRLKRNLQKLMINQDSVVYKILKSLKNEGIKATFIKIKNKLISENTTYSSQYHPQSIKDSTKEIVNLENEIETMINETMIDIPKKQPLVSIIVLTRDGLGYMQVLLKAISENTLYENFEIVVADNDSSDETIAFLEENPYNLPLKIIKNNQNLSFSKGNNEAVKTAKGELLLFLNNDTQPLKGWLCSLVQEYLNNPKMGSVGSKLIYPYKEGFENSCTIQHSGIAFRYEGDFYRPYNLGNAKNYLLEDKKVQRAAITAACLLVPRNVFEEIEGFDERYIYGYEDVDLGLKIFSKGYENIYRPDSILYHYEFGTQNKNKNNEVRERRLNNIKLFKKKWHLFLKKKYWDEKLNTKQILFTEKTLHIALAVSNKGEGIAEGDYFTATEFANELKQFGWKISYISKKHNEWYSLNEDVDIVVSFLDDYNIKKVYKSQKKVLYVAWLRNWFDRWIKNESFSMYDFVLASSKEACRYVEERSNQQAIYFPIATNENRFLNGQKRESFLSDYCFTGSYWNDEREIIKFLNPENLPYKFHIYGKNWEKIKKFEKVYKGFLNYEDMPDVYASTRLVLDDANRVTKPYGSINSRVFDALCAGSLVITNGVLGAKTEFNDLLPSFSSQKELENLLKFYLENEQERLKLVKKLQTFVLEGHTYKKRAISFKEILQREFLQQSVVIKIPAPNWNVVEEWGDYHFAKSMKKEFKKLNYRVLLQVLNEWDNGKDLNFDNVLVLRGLSQYKIKDHQFNIMWNISHPDKVEKVEYSVYDFIYVASIKWAEYLQKSLHLKNVAPLLQCSDIDLFYPLSLREDIELLFVGNSRKIFRKVIQYILPTKYNLEVYGTNWEKFIDSDYIKAQNIPNEDLHTYYNRAKIVLNDHWDDMREKGFISNRIFDVSACGKFILTDDVDGLEDIFGDSIVVYKDKHDLKKKIEYYLAHDDERHEKAKKAMDITRSLFSFKSRVAEIDLMLKKIENNL